MNPRDNCGPAEASIGMVVMDIANPFYTDLVLGARIAYKSAVIPSKSEIALKMLIVKALNCWF